MGASKSRLYTWADSEYGYRKARNGWANCPERTVPTRDGENRHCGQVAGQVDTKPRRRVCPHWGQKIQVTGKAPRSLRYPLGRTALIPHASHVAVRKCRPSNDLNP